MTALAAIGLIVAAAAAGTWLSIWANRDLNRRWQRILDELEHRIESRREAK